MRGVQTIAILLGIIVVVVLCLVLKTLEMVFKPMVVAALLSIMVSPVVEWLAARRISRPVSMSLLMVVMFTGFYLLGVIVYSTGTAFVKDLPKYQEQLLGLASQALGALRIPLEDADAYVKQLDWQQVADRVNIPALVSSTMGTFFSFVGRLALVTVFMLFMIPGYPRLVGRLRRAYDGEQSERAERVMRSIAYQIQRYLLLKTGTSAFTAAVVWVILTAFGVPYVFIWVLLTFALNFIPNVGSPIATILPILMCLLQFGWGWRFGVVAVLLSGSQLVIGNLIEPRIFGKGLNLSPVLVLFTLILWGWIWGITGAILAIPITSAIKIAFENIEPTKPIAVFMSGY